MKCMRRGGLVQNTQNGSYQSKVRWIILKPWTVKYTDISEWQQAKLYTLTILCYRQAVQNSHNLHQSVYTHILVRCTAVNITFPTHSTWRNCWKHFPLVGRQTSYPKKKFFIAQQSSRSLHSNTFHVASISPSCSPLRYQITGSQNSVFLHDLSLDLWTTVIVWCDQFPHWSFDDTTAAGKNFY